MASPVLIEEYKMPSQRRFASFRTNASLGNPSNQFSLSVSLTQHSTHMFKVSNFITMKMKIAAMTW
jgi:hypothetical protein